MPDTIPTTTAIAADDIGALVPLAQLRLSEHNPRQDADAEGIAALADSIRAIGCLQNLAGLREADGTVAVVAGGRRLRAFRLIAEQDGLDPTEVLVPMKLTDDPAVAIAWAGAENVAREALHPADEVRAYAAMADADAETIAKAFGVTVRHVKGRLKLAVLPDPILDALRSGEITLDVAAAYTVSTDPERMLEVFETARHAHYGQRPHEIRHQLTHTRVTAARGVGAFVGRTAYEAAGGIVTEDLFGTDVWFDDAELVHRLAKQKLDAVAAEVGDEGWAWTEASLEAPAPGDIVARVYPSTPDVTDEEAARYDELAELIEHGAADDEGIAEFEAMQAEMDQEYYTDAQLRVAGAHVHLRWGGGVTIERGLVRAAELPAAIEAGVVQPSRHGGTHATGLGAAGVPEEAEAKAKPIYSGALAADLAIVRTAAVQTALLSQPMLAQDLLAFVLTHDCYSTAVPIGLSTTPAANTVEGDTGLTLDERLCPQTRLSPGSWGTHLDAGEAAEAFARFRGLPKKKRQEALTLGMAHLVGATLALEPNPFVEQLAREAKTNVRGVWRPTEAFLKRLTKAQLLAIDAHVMGPDHKVVGAPLAGQTKGNIVTWLDLMFAEDPDGPRLDKAQRARMLAWTPEGMGITPEDRGEQEPADEGSGDEAEDTDASTQAEAPMAAE